MGHMEVKTDLHVQFADALRIINEQKEKIEHLERANARLRETLDLKTSALSHINAERWKYHDRAQAQQFATEVKRQVLEERTTSLREFAFYVQETTDPTSTAHLRARRELGLLGVGSNEDILDAKSWRWQLEKERRG